MGKTGIAFLPDLLPSLSDPIKHQGIHVVEGRVSCFPVPEILPPFEEEGRRKAPLSDQLELTLTP